MKETKHPTAHRALARRILALGLALWLAAMGLLTWAVAQDMLQQVDSAARSYAAYIARYGRTRSSDDESAQAPGTMENQMLDRLGMPYFFIDIEKLLPFVRPHTPDVVSSDDWIWGKWDLLYGYEVAESFYDADGNVLMDTGDYLGFQYTTKEKWNQYNIDPMGFGYVDLNRIEGGVECFRSILSDQPTGYYFTSFVLPLMRLTGYFEGNQFHPSKIERGWYLGLEGPEDDLHQMNLAHGRGQLEWETLWEVAHTSTSSFQASSSGQAESGQQSTDITIYAWQIEGGIDSLEPLEAAGGSFSSLTEVLHANGKPSKDFPFTVIYHKENLWESILIHNSHGEDIYGPFSDGIAVRCWPVAYAVFRMVPAYLASLVILAIVIGLLLRNIRRHLTEPLARLSYSITHGTTVLPDHFWEEPQALANYVLDSRQTLTDTKAELQKTKVALDYAKHAEENRRQLISNITHELKTPLAVIHSYVEGLQTGIAEEKKEHYLSVIQDETQRMDAMVLQMLDLSRLEAGKVHLSMDSFSLLALTRTITDRFLPMLEAKQITLSYDDPQDFVVRADESRIEQVITNLVSNAVKYTEEGGQIHIRLTLHVHKARFAIENTAPPLTQEALTKVWDSFYRADPSRTEPGTGLGLTLVKQIIELHRGVCQVQNLKFIHSDHVENRVEFSFTLPLE